MKEYSYIKRALIRALSEDSRATVTELADAAKCSRHSALAILNAITKEFDIKYTIDFNKQKLNLIQNHVLKISLSKKPKIEDLKRLFENDLSSQLVLTTEGDFDLVVYANTNSGNHYMQWETALSLSLAEYKPVIRPSQIVTTHIGFIPLLNKTLETIDLSHLDINQLDKNILLLLNENSRMTFRAMAHALNESADTIRYRFRRLKAMNFIQKFSLIIRKSPLDYNYISFVNYKFATGTGRRAAVAREHYMSIDGGMPLINKFQLLAPLSGSYRFFAFGCFEDEKDFNENFVAIQKKAFKEDSPEISSARIKDVIKGDLPIRNIDVRKSYNVVKWE